ncbi:MAG: hypothetical protein HQ483_15705 [Rhodospirillales bacterium]|nr:hypothetical protein [Rhodospirillales bacterium]
MSVDVATGSERLDALLARHPMPSWRMFAWPVMGLLMLAIGWSYFVQLDQWAVSLCNFTITA